MKRSGRARRAVCLLVGLLLSAAAADSARATVIDVGGRTATVHVPASYDPATPAPVVLLLHGYTMTGSSVERWMGFTPLAERHGFLFVSPDGTRDCNGDAFWNATASCCNFCGSTVDDVGWLTALLDQIQTQFNVDADRVYVVGYSNGGFMAYRLACEHADRFAAIASLGGATYRDTEDCTPSAPVHTLQIHGTVDATILYGGGSMWGGDPYPGAIETVETWATYNECALAPDTSPPPLDLIRNLPGKETTVTRYASGCRDGGSSELWTMTGAVHVPLLSPGFGAQIASFLLAHPKPAAQAQSESTRGGAAAGGDADGVEVP